MNERSWLRYRQGSIYEGSSGLKIDPNGNGEPLRDFKQGIKSLRLRNDLSKLFN